MRSRVIALPLGRPGLEPFERVGLMQQDVAPSAGGHDGLRRPGVARDHEHAVPGLEPIAECLVPVGVRDQERGDGDVAVLIDDPGPRIRGIHLPTVGRMGLVPFGPDLDVPLVRLGQVLRHVPGTAGPEEAEWRLPLADPPGVDDIGEPDGVVAVQVGEEDDPDLLGKEPRESDTSSRPPRPAASRRLRRQRGRRCRWPRQQPRGRSARGRGWEYRSRG